MWFKKHNIDIRETAKDGTAISTNDLARLSWAERNTLRIERHHWLQEAWKKNEPGLNKFEARTRYAQMSECYHEMILAERKLNSPSYEMAALKAGGIVLFGYFCFSVVGAITGCAISFFLLQSGLNAERIYGLQELEEAKRNYKEADISYTEAQKKSEAI